MQDFQLIPGLAGRIFSSGGGEGGGSSRGGGGGVEHRRMRGYPSCGQEPPAKCPRCDSVNTKFCYYNNYNLSQPRHFCKSCRRYWTKGGVLRNVPVGGGCRKSSSKRSSTSSSSSASKKPSSAGKDRRRQPASRSSSDSSSLTAATTDASASASASIPNPTLFAPHTSNPNHNPDFDPVGEDPLVPVPEIYVEAGSFTSLMASAASVPAMLGLGYSDPPPLRLPALQPHQKAGFMAVGVSGEEELRMPGLAAGFVEPVDVTALSQGRMNCGAGGGISGLDWPGAADPGLFDLTSAVDPGAYWNQGHWGDTDLSLYFP